MSRVIEQPRYTCALGVQQSVLAIPRAIPILHSGPGCSSKVSAIKNSAGQQGEGYAGGAHVPCSNATENDVVFGGERRLHETIRGALKVMDGDLFVVLTGCTADIVGDDVPSVVSEYKDEGYPIINVETGGFKGNNYFGHNLFLKEMIDQYIGEVTQEVRKGLVNVFSVIPYQNPNWRGDLEAIKKLLTSIGLEVNILFGHESKGVSEWKDIPNAQFNLVLSPWVGLEAAEYLHKKFNTPYLHYPVLPIGAEETSRFLRTVGEFGGVEKEKVDAVIREEEERFYKYFVDTADFFTEIKNGLPYELYTIADSTYALGVSKYLINELGYTPKRAFLIDLVPERYKGFITEEFEKLDSEYINHVHYEEDGGRIEAIIRGDKNRPQKTLILGSQWENDLAKEIEAAITYLSIPILENLILNKSYIGYFGGLRLIEDIYTNIIGNKNFTSRFRDQIII